MSIKSCLEEIPEVGGKIPFSISSQGLRWLDPGVRNLVLRVDRGEMVAALRARPVLRRAIAPRVVAPGRAARPRGHRLQPAHFIPIRLITRLANVEGAAKRVSDSSRWLRSVIAGPCSPLAASHRSRKRPTTKSMAS